MRRISCAHDPLPTIVYPAIWMPGITALYGHAMHVAQTWQHCWTDIRTNFFCLVCGPLEKYKKERIGMKKIGTNKIRTNKIRMNYYFLSSNKLLYHLMILIARESSGITKSSLQSNLLHFVIEKRQQGPANVNAILVRSVAHALRT